MRWLLFVLLLPLAAVAAEIPVKRVEGEPAADPLSTSWLGQPAVNVPLYPQASVPPATRASKATVKVRAQRGATTLALHLEWADRKPARERGIGAFADAAAVQWPQRLAGEPPYIGMGHRGAPVALWFWRADGTAELLAAEGFGTLTAQPAGGVQARGEWKNGVWRVVLSRAAAESQESLPVAFAVWNGEDAERNGLKRLSAWQMLSLEGSSEKVSHPGLKAGDSSPRVRVEPGGSRFEHRLADPGMNAGDGTRRVVSPHDTAKPAGSAMRGKRLMQEKGCAACHSYPGNPAKPAIGPELTYAGGLHAPAYLEESLREPSKVVVPCKGCFAEQVGRRVSVMPPFEGNAAERDDLLAFLRSLR